MLPGLDDQSQIGTGAEGRDRNLALLEDREGVAGGVKEVDDVGEAALLGAEDEDGAYRNRR